MNKPQEQRKTGSRKRLQRKQELPLHMMLLPGLLIVLVYNYGPMFGLLMAFENYKPTKGILGSAVGRAGEFQTAVRISGY